MTFNYFMLQTLELPSSRNFHKSGFHFLHLSEKVMQGIFNITIFRFYSVLLNPLSTYQRATQVWNGMQVPVTTCSLLLQIIIFLSFLKLAKINEITSYSISFRLIGMSFTSGEGNLRLYVVSENNPQSSREGVKYSYLLRST